MIDPSIPLSLRTSGDVQARLGSALRQLRKGHSITLQGLARSSGIPVSTIARMECHGQGSIETWVKLMAALGQLDRLHDMLEAATKAATAPKSMDELRRDQPATGSRG